MEAVTHSHSTESEREIVCFGKIKGWQILSGPSRIFTKKGLPDQVTEASLCTYQDEKRNKNLFTNHLTKVS